MKCPHCGNYSLVYDWLRNTYTCHVYAAHMPAETMPRTIARQALSGPHRASAGHPRGRGVGIAATDPTAPRRGGLEFFRTSRRHGGC